jgi:hypothetical protein
MAAGIVRGLSKMAAILAIERELFERAPGHCRTAHQRLHLDAKLGAILGVAPGTVHLRVHRVASAGTIAGFTDKQKDATAHSICTRVWLAVARTSREPRP